MSTEQTPNTGAPGSPSRRSFLGIAAGSGVVALLAGCSIPARGTAVPIGRTTQATVLGVPNDAYSHSTERSRHIGNADPKQLNHLTNPLAIVRRGKHPPAQSL
jgi:TAT (twin-arginine translocation) pathway signal sequence